MAHTEIFRKIAEPIVDHLLTFKNGGPNRGEVPSGLSGRAGIYWGNSSHLSAVNLDRIEESIQGDMRDNRFGPYIKLFVGAMTTCNLTSRIIETDHSWFYTSNRKKEDLIIVENRAAESIKTQSTGLFPDDKYKLARIITLSMVAAPAIVSVMLKERTLEEVREELIPTYDELSQIFISSPRFEVPR